MCTVHCTPHNEHCTPHNEHGTPHNEHDTPHNEHCTPHNKHCTPHNEHCTPHNEHCTLHKWTLYTAQWTLYTAQCTVYSDHCTLYSVHCPPNVALFSLHIAHSYSITLHFLVWSIFCRCILDHSPGILQPYQYIEDALNNNNYLDYSHDHQDVKRSVLMLLNNVTESRVGQSRKYKEKFHLLYTPLWNELLLCLYCLMFTACSVLC